MTPSTLWSLFLTAVIVQAIVVGITVVMERRSPSASLAWLLTLILLPGVGILLYGFIGRRAMRRARRRRIHGKPPALPERACAAAGALDGQCPPPAGDLFRLGIRAGGYPVTRRNRVEHLRDAAAFEERFWSGGSVAKLYQSASREWPDSPMVAVFITGFREWKRWEGNERAGLGRQPEVGGDLLTNVRRAMTVALNREMDNLGRGLTFLATVGSTSPFIGLFGTIWGIMNAFRGLAGAKTATLTMMAPGIAEALTATAMGLVAAIPAVIAYNKYAADLRSFHQKMDNFGAEFLNILERQTSRRMGKNQ